MNRNEFLSAVAAHTAAGRKWFLDREGKIRSHEGLHCFCPLEVLADSRATARNIPHDWNEAAFFLDIDRELAEDIVLAADGKATAPPKLRQSLLTACGLREETNNTTTRRTDG